MLLHVFELLPIARCRLAAGNWGDLWMPCVVFILLLISFIYGLKKLISSENPENTLMISLVWVVYNMIPPFLLLWYTWVGQGSTLRVRPPLLSPFACSPAAALPLPTPAPSAPGRILQHASSVGSACFELIPSVADNVLCSPALQFVCKTLFWLSTLLAFGALVLIWLFFPSSYDYGRALGDSHYFFKTQRVGRLPANNGVSWRADALLQEEAIKISTSTSAYDLSGGYMTVRTFLADAVSHCVEAL